MFFLIPISPPAVGSSRHQQAEHSNSRQNPAAARRTQRKRAEPSTSRQIPAGTDSAGDGTIQNLHMISFNGHASHRTIDNGTTIKIAINTIQGCVESCQQYTAHSDETVFKSITASQTKKRTIKIQTKHCAHAGVIRLQVTWNDVSLVVVVQKQSSSSLAVASGSN